MIRVGGVVLCGGQSSRMGRPKAMLPFGDEVLLSRVVRLLSEVVEPVVVVAAPGQELRDVRVEIVRDPVPDQGPLQGLLTGLTALGDRVDAVYLSSCDLPFLSSAFVRRMIDLLGDGIICAPSIAGFRHPLAAVYRIEVAAQAAQLLSTGQRRLSLLLDVVPARLVGLEELGEVDGSLALRNINSPEEYEVALREWTSRTAART
jgi:molybdenum cofactor guanylyltransferase